MAYGVGPETLCQWLVKYREANGGSETAFLNYPDVRIMPMFSRNCRSGAGSCRKARHDRVRDFPGSSAGRPRECIGREGRAAAWSGPLPAV